MSWLDNQMLVKIGVVVLVLAFMLQTWGSQQGRTLQEDGEQTPQAKVLLGVAIANATVVSYGGSLGPSVTVEGTNPELDDAIGRMKKEGLVSYTSPTRDGVVLNLAKDVNISTVVQRLANMNLTMISRAEVSFSEPLVFYTENGPVEVNADSMTMDLDPSIGVGYDIGLKITATISEGRIIQKKEEVMPIMKDFMLAGQVSELFDQYRVVGIYNWEDRGFNSTEMEQRLSGKFGNPVVHGFINNTVGFSGPAGSGIVGQLEALNLTYAFAIGNAGILLSPEFTDAARIESDVGGILGAENITLYYPDSYARVDFETDDFSKDFLNASLGAREFIAYRNMTVRIGKSIYDSEDRAYEVLGREYTDFFSYTNDTGGHKILGVRANVLGNRIINYTVNQ